MRVLIVDPDPELAQMLKVGLQFGFYEKAKRLARDGRQMTESLEVEHVADADSALRFLAAAPQPVDLIFTELRSNQPEAYAFLETCRSQHRKKYGEIIVVIDRGSTQEVQPGLLAGAKDYLLKPFTPYEVMGHMVAAWRDGA